MHALVLTEHILHSGAATGTAALCGLSGVLEPFTKSFRVKHVYCCDFLDNANHNVDCLRSPGNCNIPKEACVRALETAMPNYS